MDLTQAFESSRRESVCRPHATIRFHLHFTSAPIVLSHNAALSCHDFRTIKSLFSHCTSRTSTTFLHHLSQTSNQINKTIMAPWDAAEDRALLLSVIAVAQVQPNWEDVATQLGKTKEAVRYDYPHHVYILSTYICHSQRFAKLKKEAADPSAATTNTGDGAAPAAVATPTPHKRKTKAKAKKVTSDEEDEVEDTPLTKKSKKIIKEENEDEDEA